MWGFPYKVKKERREITDLLAEMKFMKEDKSIYIYRVKVKLYYII